MLRRNWVGQSEFSVGTDISLTPPKSSKSQATPQKPLAHSSRALRVAPSVAPDSGIFCEGVLLENSGPIAGRATTLWPLAGAGSSARRPSATTDALNLYGEPLSELG
jgi:hypothetical protein